VLSCVTMVTIIASANMFGQSYLMTKGGPGIETRTAIYYITDTGLKNY
jgi:multiple sugar transport system permease protein